MKAITQAILLFCVPAIFVLSCKKNSNSSVNKPILTLSKSSVKKGEPLVVSSNEVRANSFIKWSVIPFSPNTWISPAGNKSVILFSNQGSYSITANYFSDSLAVTPYDSSSSPVTVSDSIYNDTVAHCNSILEVPILVGDQLILTPISYSDTGLVLLAHTVDIYDNYYPSLNYTTGTDSTVGYEFDFGTILEYPCGNWTSAPTPATTSLAFHGLTSGTQDLTIVLNGAVYRGTLTVSSTECSFSWNYSSGVIISPLAIQKQ
jgi:hypothetical protein